MNDTDNIKILFKHFTKVYNRDSSFDPKVLLQKLRKRNIIQHFAEPPTRDKLKEAIKKMNTLAPPCKSGLSPTAMKNLPEEHEDELLAVLQRYWSGTDANPEWYKSILRWIYKGKGKKSDPNNFRGICLQDVVARYLSSILSTRLLKMLEKEGLETQLGSQPGRGCRDTLFILRSLLQVR
jgi:hypothetical protein